MPQSYGRVNSGSGAQHSVSISPPGQSDTHLSLILTLLSEVGLSLKQGLHAFEMAGLGASWHLWEAFPNIEAAGEEEAVSKASKLSSGGYPVPSGILCQSHDSKLMSLKNSNFCIS